VGGEEKVEKKEGIFPGERQMYFWFLTGEKFLEEPWDTSAVELAAAVKRVLKWSVVKRAHRVRAAARWAAQFTWERTAELTVGVYQDVLAKQS
jgi:glycosyltransferase involved in cell wall biosynthesis